MSFEGFKPKSSEELENQFKKAQQVLGEKIYPPDTSSLDVSDISNLKMEYKTRYDAYISAIRAECRGELRTKEISYAKEWIQALNNLDSYIKDHESKDNPLLREKQFLVFKRIRDFLEQGKRKGYIKLPTGVGKTILFLKIAEALGMKTLVVSPSIVIMDQNAQETEEFTDSEFGKYYGKEKDLSKKITHITYHSLVNAIKEGKINPDDIPVAILDEAHESLGPERTQTVNQFKSLVIGFTATSEFSEEKKVSNLLPEEIFRMDLNDAIKEGLICQTQTIHAHTNVDLSSVQIKNGEYDQSQIEKILNVRGRNIAALELYRNKFSHLKGFFNCSGVKHAEDVAKLFNEHGIKAACITGDTPPGDGEGQRGWILKNYAEGKIKVLTNARVLLRGFNESTCAVTFNLHPTLSYVDAEQRARSGRLDKNDPDKWNYVIDFIDKNAKKPQILYSEILGDAKVWDITKKVEGDTIRDGSGKFEPKLPINLDEFSIDGLKVTVDTKKIMELTKNNIDLREGWNYESLLADVIKKGISSPKDYLKNYKENRWPTIATLISQSEFPKNLDGSNDWDTFFGREKFGFEKIRADVIKKGISSTVVYRKKNTENKWPSIPTLVAYPEFPKNKDGSSDWDTFFGREKFGFEKIRKEVIEKGITSSKDYYKQSGKNNWPNIGSLTSQSEFPKNLDGSNDWDTFFGREKFGFEKFRNKVREKGITTSQEYEDKSSENKWPIAKTLTSKPEFPKKPDGSNDWGAFLGRKKKKEWNFNSLSIDVKQKGITSTSDYADKRKENNWPALKTFISYPEFPKKPDGSRDWDTFFGREKFDFKKFREDVIKKHISSSKDYLKNYKENRWPTITTLTSMLEFPKKPDGSRDWDTFLGKKD
jgi:superfamily II DNA or RNA helicase